MHRLYMKNDRKKKKMRKAITFFYVLLFSVEERKYIEYSGI